MCLALPAAVFAPPTRPPTSPQTPRTAQARRAAAPRAVPKVGETQVVNALDFEELTDVIRCE